MTAENKRSRVLNVVIRVTTLATRFIFTFFVAKLLNPSDLGLYGLVTAAVGYALYLVGLDFYTFTTREMPKHDRASWGGMLKNQAALSLILYVIVLPMLTIVFISDLLPWRVAKWFYFLIIVEHVCQELSRLFIAISEQLFASILLFLRQGAWAIAITALILANSYFRSLDAIFAAWSIAGTLTIVLGIYRLHKLRLGGWTNNINWEWVVKGIKVSVPLLAATLAIRGVFTVDRYWLKAMSNLDVVGAYVLFFGVSSTLSTFLDAGVFSYAYPSLITAYQSDQPEVFRKRMREMLIHTTLISAVFSAVSLMLMPYLLRWLNRPTYTAHQSLYSWLLLAMVLNALGMVPHYSLYAQKHDRPIIQSHVAGFITFNASVWWLSLHHASIAIPAALCISFTFILFWKILACSRLTPSRFRIR